MKHILGVGVLSIATSTVISAAADGKGAPIFADSFETVETFAENWSAKGATSADGRAHVPIGAWMRPRTPLPKEFEVEADIVFDHSANHPAQTAWGGFMLDGHHFQVQPCGKGFAVWKLPGAARADGRYEPIPRFAKGQSVKMRAVRRHLPGSTDSLKYVFTLNGALAAEFIAPAASGKPDLIITGHRAGFEIDNFLVSAIRQGGDSPNTVLNSGFEHGEDGIPLYYGLHGDFDFVRRPAEEYETRFLKRFALDSAEKHSGKYSLRVLVNNTSRSIVIAPWQTGIVKGSAGVFSVWMKSSEDDLPVEIALAPGSGDGRRIVTVGKNWHRYEVTRRRLPAKGVYSPISISPVEPWKGNAVLWLDDLQCEMLNPPDGEFEANKSYASKYRPSSLDAIRFGAKQTAETPARYLLKKLPDGVKPQTDLDKWSCHALPISTFWHIDTPPTKKTLAYIACDMQNLYVGFRNFGENPASIVRPREARDRMIYQFDGLEMFFKPAADAGSFHFMAGANGDRFDLFANNIAWNGNWLVTAEENRAAGSVDYLVTIPFSDFARSGIDAEWKMNLCRNSYCGAKETISSAKTRREGYKDESTWNVLALPKEVSAKWAGKTTGKRGKTKDAVLGRLDFYMNEPEAAWRITDETGRVSTITKPMAEIPFGTNVVTFTANGRKYSDRVVRLKYRKEAIQINRWTRSIVKDGKNMLVTSLCVGIVGFFNDPTGIGYRKMMPFIKSKGFTSCQALIPSWSHISAEAKFFMDAVLENGLMYLNWCDFGRKCGAGDKRDDLTVENMVDFFRQYENSIISNLVIDEPELYMGSAEAKAWLERMKSRYPYLPVMMNNTVMGIPSRYADLKTDILMLDDYLTNSEGRTVESVVAKVDEMIAVPGGKPCWMFIVGDNMTLHYKNPSYAEQVAQSWGAIASGCTGISWYIGFPRTEGSWRAMVDVNREVQSLAKIILSEEIAAEAWCSQPKNRIRHKTCRLDGSWYIVSCNIDSSPAENTVFTLPREAPQEGSVEVLFENRKLPLKGGSFTDDYRGHSRHVYRIKKEEKQ